MQWYSIGNVSYHFFFFTYFIDKDHSAPQIYTKLHIHLSTLLYTIDNRSVELIS